MGKKILLADDSITIQKVIELTFSDEDFEVVTVGNGRLAIERVQEAPPDIVLCDIIMPEKDGYEVCDFVKKNASLAHIPVLLLTGAFEPFDQERAARVGCDGFLAKPFEPQTLIAKVKDLLQRSDKLATPAQPAPRPAAAMSAPTPPPTPVPAAPEPASFEPAPLEEMDEPFFSPEPPPPRRAAARCGAGRAVHPGGSLRGGSGLRAAAPSGRGGPEPGLHAPARAGSDPGLRAGLRARRPGVSAAVASDARRAAAPGGAGRPAAAHLRGGCHAGFSGGADAGPATGSRAAAAGLDGATVDVPLEERAQASVEAASAEPEPFFEEVFEEESSTTTSAVVPDPPTEPEVEALVEPVVEPEPEPAPLPVVEPTPAPLATAPLVAAVAAAAAAVPEPAAAVPEQAGFEQTLVEEMSFAELTEAAAAQPPAAAQAPPSGSSALPVPMDMVSQIAQRVVAQISEKVIREIAWEVIPDLAEVLIKKEIERLKAELQET